MAEQRADGMSLLKGLKRNLPDRGLPERGKVASEEDAERRILAGAAPDFEVAPVTSSVLTPGVALAVAHDVAPEAQQGGIHEVLLDTTQDRRPGVTQYTSLLRKKKKYTTTFTLRMDLDLYRRLKDIADFNELQMTAIINEAIGLHLAAFEQPPVGWKKRR